MIPPLDENISCNPYYGRPASRTFLADCLENWVNDAINKYWEKKFQIFSSLVLERYNTDINWEKERDKRFRCFSLEKKGIIETWYYDDGSDDGVKVVSFTNIEPNLLFKMDSLINTDLYFEYVNHLLEDGKE